MIVPVDVPLVTGGKAAQTDTSGNFTSVTPVHPANWSVIRLVAQTTGNPTWLLLSDNNLPLDFATGPLCSMGHVLVAPGQRLTTQVVAAAQAVSVLGHLVGVMSPSLEEVLPYYLPSPNPIGSTIGVPIVFIGNILAASGAGTVTKTFPIPAGTRACLVDVLVSTTSASLTVTGHQSGFIYLSASPGGAAASYAFLISDANDTSIDVVLQSTGAGLNSNVDISGLPLGTVAQLAPGGTIDVTDRTGRLLGIVQEGSAPPLWQAPGAIAAIDTNLNLAAGASATIIAGVALQTVRMFAGRIYTPDAAGAFGSFRDTNGNAAGTGTGNTSSQVFAMDYYGAPLPGGAGVGLVIHNFGGAASNYLYSVASSQG